MPVTGLAGAVDSEKFFKIEVPEGQTNLLFTMSGGTGNADIYVKKDSKPTTSDWDYRQTTAGNNESISLTNDSLQGTWYVMLKGVKAYSGVTLVANYSRRVETVVTLTNGVPVTGLSGIAGTQKFFKIDVPVGQTKFEIRISGGTGDADLYVRRGTKPTTSAYDYRPYLVGNDETVTVDNPTAGTWYIMIRGYQSFSDITLLATYGGATPGYGDHAAKRRGGHRSHGRRRRREVLQDRRAGRPVQARDRDVRRHRRCGPVRQQGSQAHHHRAMTTART